ncbi:MAG: MdtA/MuxA family multidrug efflux RND transporter periplasmic adaptor subunit [Candidatus Binataceae bacterium]
MDSSTLPEGGARPASLLQQERLSRPWAWISILSILVVVGYFVVSRIVRTRSASAQPSAAMHAVVPVAAAAATRGDLSRYLTAIGSVTAFNTVTVKTRVDGQIVKVAFKEGQTVHQGDVLVQIDPRPYQAALSQVRGQLAKDRATLVNAQQTLVRDQTLYRQDVIAAQDLDNQQSLVGQSEGAVKSDLANLDAAEVQVDYSRITAPITGRIGLRLVDLGNIVHAADTTGLAVITQLQPIAVDFSIPEDNLPQVIQDMRKGQKLPVYAYDRELKNRLATGSLETFDSQIDQTTGTIKLKAIFPNTDYSLFPNQFVNVRLQVDTLRDMILAPAAAIQRNGQITFVYVVKPDHTVEVRTVKIGATQGDVVALASGITPGELVVTDGLDKVTAGAKVSVQPAADTTTQASGSTGPQRSP